MAEVQGKPPSAAQDTGNPVLDSTVNIVAARGIVSPESIEQVHAAVLKIAMKEPGGLRFRGPFLEQVSG